MPILIDMDKGEWLKAVLHAHSSNSDGWLSPCEVVRFYKAAGYDIVSITDHNKLTPMKDEEAIFLPGIEIDVKSRVSESIYHIVLTGLEEEPGDSVRRDPQRLIDWGVDRGLFVTVAHPYWSMLSTEDLDSLERYHAIEVYNTVSEMEVSRGRSDVYWDYLLNKEVFVWGTAVDDAHYYVFDALGGWVMVNAEEKNAEAVLEALKKGRFYSSMGPEIRYFAVEENKIEIEARPLSVLRILSYDSRGYYFNMRFLDKLKELKGTKHVIDFEEYSENGAKIMRMALRRNVTVEVRITEPWIRIKLEGSFPFKRYVRAEVVDENGLSAWTNPVKL